VFMIGIVLPQVGSTGKATGERKGGKDENDPVL
jgi:hypothetical protein